jgi:hypothetical protein
MVGYVVVDLVSVLVCDNFLAKVLLVFCDFGNFAFDFIVKEIYDIFIYEPNQLILQHVPSHQMLPICRHFLRPPIR